jgi:hypothetical protein
MIMEEDVRAPKPSPDDHPFEPKDQWWGLCKHCNLAQAAHLSSKPEVIEEMQAHFASLPRAADRLRVDREAETERLKQGGRARIVGYMDDDDDDEN